MTTLHAFIDRFRIYSSNLPILLEGSSIIEVGYEIANVSSWDISVDANKYKPNLLLT